MGLQKNKNKLLLFINKIVTFKYFLIVSIKMDLQGNILRKRKVRFKLLCDNLLKSLIIYFTPHTRLTGRERLRKLRVETFISYLLLILLLILAFQWTHIYSKVHKSIHIENATFFRTGFTPISCYSNYRDVSICCADKHYFTATFLNNSRKTIRVYECYKFEDLE